MPDGRDCHLDEARRVLQDPEFGRGQVAPAAVEFDGPNIFHFASPRPCDHAVNNIVPGRLYPCGTDWRARPVVLLLHGWNDALNHVYYFPRHARRLNRLGLSAVTIQLPWQFDRYPRGLGGWGNFLSADLLHTVEGALQALAEARALVQWLRAQGCPFVGIWGVSLGAWLAGLAICHDRLIDAAALVTPVARVDHLIAEAKFCGPIRRALQDASVPVERLNLFSHVPMIDKSRILLIEGEHDVFVAKEDVEELWRAWGHPEIWRHRSGHISVLVVPRLAGRMARWMAAKASEPVVK